MTSHRNSQVQFVTGLLVFSAIVCLPSCARGPKAIRAKIVSHWEEHGVSQGEKPRDSAVIVYRMGDRIRTEPLVKDGVRTVFSIQRCDTGVVYAIRPDIGEYTEARMNPRARADEVKRDVERSAKPNLIFDTQAVDTGETKTAFGHTARRYLI